MLWPFYTYFAIVGCLYLHMKPYQVLGTTARLKDPGKDYAGNTSVAEVEDNDWHEFMKIVNIIYTVGFMISSATLTVSLGLLYWIPSLNNVRMKIHKNLFASVLGQDIICIIWFQFIISNDGMVESNNILCQVVHVVMEYFVVSTFSWLCVESIFLYFSVVTVFYKEDRAKSFYTMFGWLLPFFVTVIYTAARLDTADTARCWAEPNTSSLNTISIPIWGALLESFVLMLSVLCANLRKTRKTGFLRKAKDTIRGTLVLTPIFSMHVILHFLRQEPGTTAGKIYEVVAALAISLQGVYLAVFFCFTNEKVSAAVKRCFLRRTAMESIPMHRVSRTVRENEENSNRGLDEVIVL